MKLVKNISDGVIRIDFDPIEVKDCAMQELYTYLQTTKKTGIIAWNDDPYELRNGIIYGRYNLATTDERSASHMTETIVKILKK